ncbi:MAG: BatD family protein [Verrucomicrobiae bacterium]|nr:BatD family protein [Verrucomicrobiae bacterium]
MERFSRQNKIIRRQRGTAVSRGLAGGLGWWLSMMVATAVTFTASVDRDTVYLGERVGFSLTFDGAQPEGTPPAPAVSGLQFAYNGPSSQFSFVNGQTTAKITHNYTITPLRVGEFVIPPVKVTLGQQTLITQPIHLTVLKAGTPSPEAVAHGSQPAFLQLQLPKTNVYLGEIITGEFQLYLRDGVNAGQFQFTATPAEGLTVGKMAELPRRRMQVGNAAYTVVPIAVSLTPIKTGPLTVGPITAAMVIELPSNNRRRDLFDPFGMFSKERRQLSLASDAQSLQCQPLPAEGRPANFTGAVGNFSMTVSAGPTNVTTGDPITVRVAISGHGGLDALTLPEQTTWKDFKTYPPTSRIETSDQLGLQGTKTFEQIVSPENPDLKELPPFTFAFFNPETKTYQTLSQPGTPLIVRPGGTVVAPTVVANHPTANHTPPPQLDIVPIKTRLGKTSSGPASVGFSPTFVTLNLAPALALIGAMWWRRRTEALTNNPRLRRRRQVEATLRDGQEKLRVLAEQNQSEAFFAELMRLLQEKLGERLDLPASAITEAVVDEKLRPRGVTETTLAATQELFQATNLARYAPIRSSQELAAFIPKLESVLRELDEVKS